MFTPQVKATFMERALAQSEHALPACRPNPPVGCVIVHGEDVVALGFTGPPGRPHAEVAALSGLAAHGRASWAPGELDLFVTLEPCSFVGRTPSCAVALARSGIRRVFVGTIDPDPRNQGRGLQLLRDAGVEVEVGIAEDRVLAFIGPYLIRG
jgi:pyrimidine deaminase RibD-like protein